MRQFNNLLEVITHFADAQVATDHLIQLRWGGKIKCVYCLDERVYTLKGKTKRFKCGKCRQQFSATKGSIFESSPLPLQKWFAAIYLISSHKKGISSHQLARDLSITQKSAWFVLHRVRYLLQSGSFEQTDTDTFQMDETFVGGKEKNKHKYLRASHMPTKTLITSGRSAYVVPDTKIPVAGILQTGGKVITQKVDNIKAKTLVPMLQKYVNPGVTVVTDEHVGYAKLASLGYMHETVKHKLDEYVRDGFHTNGIENFWSLFKRGIIGIYHQVSEKHLDKYLDEFEFRYNTRTFGEAERFDNVLAKCNCRLTYDELIAK